MVSLGHISLAAVFFRQRGARAEREGRNTARRSVEVRLSVCHQRREYLRDVREGSGQTPNDVRARVLGLDPDRGPCERRPIVGLDARAPGPDGFGLRVPRSREEGRARGDVVLAGRGQHGTRGLRLRGRARGLGGRGARDVFGLSRKLLDFGECLILL